MASLTPLSKGLIGLAVLGGMASAAWHLYLKDQIGGGAAQQQSTPATPSTAPSAHISPTPTEAAPTTPVLTPAPASVPTATAAQVAGLSATANAELGRKLLAEGNFAQARVHLEQAVQDGDAASACLLGEMTLQGQGGIPASQEKAAKLFQTAQARNTICFTAGQ